MNMQKFTNFIEIYELYRNFIWTMYEGCTMYDVQCTKEEAPPGGEASEMTLALSLNAAVSNRYNHVKIIEWNFTHNLPISL